MKRLAVLACLLTATFGLAQHDPFDFQMASVILLQNKAVQKELKVTEAQRATMNKAADKHRSAMTAYQKQLEAKQKDKTKPLNVDASRVDGMFVELKKGVFATLSKVQLKRLREISLQQLGIVALTDPTVATRVGLSKAEQSKFTSVYEAGLKEADSIAQSGQAQLEVQLRELRKKYPNPKTDAEKKKVMDEAQKKAATIEKRIDPQIEKVRQATFKKLESMLSAKQKSAWKALLGKTFAG